MRTPRLRRPLLTLTALATALPAAAVTALPAAQAQVPDRRVVHKEWAGAQAFAEGRSRGLEARNDRLRLAHPVGTADRYEYGTWTSPWVGTRFSFTELVPSWSARTPGTSWVKVEVRARSASQRSSWDTMARWAQGDATFTRSSPASQPDDLGRVAYDTWLTGGASAWQVRVTLLRRTGGTAKPRLDAVGAMVSRLPAAASVSTSRPGSGPALGTVLPVPRYSQMVHDGEYPQYDGGGEAWCSPTSTTMVLGYYRALPPASAYSWVRRDYPDRVVAEVARRTYDAGFGGTGNWPFNTAYAATRAGHGFVTRLHNLREAQRFIAAGIPLVASVTFGPGELSGAPISATNGHLLVIVGFRSNGDVVVNDPAASTRAGVRRTYDRGQFEDAWLKRYPSSSSMRGSGGMVYVIHDDAHPLPARNRHRNW